MKASFGIAILYILFSSITEAFTLNTFFAGSKRSCVYDTLKQGNLGTSSCRVSTKQNKKLLLSQLSSATDEDVETATKEKLFFVQVGSKTEETHHINIEKNAEIELQEPQETSLPFASEISRLLLSPQIEVIDTFLVLVSSLFVALGTLPATSLPPESCQLIQFVDTSLTYIFGIAFFTRWYGVGKLRVEYLTKPLALLDLLVTVIPLVAILPSFGFINMPSWFQSNSGLVNLRLLRILRLSRVLTDLETFSKFEITLGLKPSDVKSYQLELAKVLLSIFTLLSVSTGLIYTAEYKVNPQIPDYFTALYFGLTTLTTGMLHFEERI